MTRYINAGILSAKFIYSHPKLYIFVKPNRVSEEACEMDYRKMAEEHGQIGGCPCEACFSRRQELKRLENTKYIIHIPESRCAIEVLGALDEDDAIARAREMVFQSRRCSSSTKKRLM